MSKQQHTLSDEERVRRCPKHLMQKNVLPCDADIWKRIKTEHRPYNIFVNIPYIPDYHQLQATLVATLIQAGLVPILASLRSEGQPIRLCKICELMQSSKYCVSDLSITELHNIPFELGFFLGIGRQGHSMILIDKKYKEIKGTRIRKFDAQLSNLKGIEIIVHDANPKVLARELLKRMRRDVPEATVPQKLGPLLTKIEKFSARVLTALMNNTLDEFVEAVAVTHRRAEVARKKR